MVLWEKHWHMDYPLVNVFFQTIKKYFTCYWKYLVAIITIKLLFYAWAANPVSVYSLSGKQS